MTDLDRDALGAIRGGKGNVIDALDKAAAAMEAPRDRDEAVGMRAGLSAVMDGA